MTKRSPIQLLWALLIALIAINPALAQSVTSAGLNGRIVDASGNPVEGANVEVIHTPSGTSKTATTDADGRFTARGLRVGGPYQVTASKDGAGAAARDDVFLLLGETGTVNMSLIANATAETAADLGRVEVIGTALSDTFVPDNMGTNTNVTREQIEAFPSIARSLQDYARLDPRIVQIDKDRGGSISAGGQNGRFNNITIDGVPTNDSFGLNDNGTPSLNNPFSIDTIEEFNIGVASYDVTQTDFVGANINAITKSGTNEFSGSAYYLYRERDWTGDFSSSDADELGVNEEFSGFEDEQTYGLTLGGPIVKDTLFFFLSYEEFTRDSPAPQSTAPITAEQIAEVASIAQSVYGIDIGSSGIAGLENEDKKFLAKIDWNINDAHRMSARYNLVEGSTLITPNQDRDDVSLSSHWYAQEQRFETVVGQLYSDWTANFSTEIQASYGKFKSVPTLFARLPQVRVTVDDRGNQINFGTEQFRHANVLKNDTTTFSAIGDWFLGDHNVKFGTDFERNDAFNLFLESSLGRYEFDSIDDFRNGDYSDYVLRASSTGLLGDAAADFANENYGLFIQDTWTLDYNLTLMFGLRLDTPNIDDTPRYNELFEQTYGFRNDATIDGNSVLQPRFGFNYTFDTERNTQLRGGVGLFVGSAPNVWLSNSFTNNGLAISVFGDRSGDFGFTPNPDAQPRPNPSAPRQDVDVLAPGFEQPTVWKANLAFDHELPWWDLIASAELLLTQTENAIHYEHLNLGDATGLLPDGRLAYWRNLAAGSAFNSGASRANRDSRFNDVLLLKSSGKGSAEQLTLSVEKPLGEHWYAKVSYTLGDAEEVSPGTSSRAISNWNGRAIFNPNEEISSTANTAIDDRFTAAISYRHFFFDDLQTTFSMFYEGRSGRPFSYTFIGDANGDNIFGNDLFYVPSGPDDVVFNDPAQEAAFWDFIASNEYLDSHRGEVVGRNTNDAPWVHQFDVRISQEIPGFGKGKGEIFFDILNFGNLLNDEWGIIEEVGFPYRASVAGFGGVDPATGNYVYTFPGDPDLFRVRDEVGQSRWALQVGVRYEF